MKAKPSNPFLLDAAIYVTTLALLALSIGISLLDTGGLGNVLKLLLAVAIATLLVLYYMDLRHATALVRLFALGGLLWVVFMFVLTFADYLTR